MNPSATPPGTGAKTALPTEYGMFDAVPFVDANGNCHVALIIGEVSGKEDVFVRLHSECITGDVFGSRRCDCGEQLHSAFKMIAGKGTGIIIYLRQEGRGIGLLNKLRAYALQDNGADTVEANHQLGFRTDERDYHFAAEILHSLGVKSVQLLTNNPEKIKGMNISIPVTGRIPLIITPSPYNAAYLKAKKEKMGHLL